MEKIVEPFTSRIGEKITTSLDFNDNKQALEGNLEVLTSKAFDIETEVKKAELSGKKRKMEVGSWLEKVKKFKEEYDILHAECEKIGVYKRLRKGNHVKDLKDGVEQLLKQSETFRELVIDACETSRERLFSTQLHGEALKQELDNILAWVEAKSDQVPMIGIYGMGGVGKTTLANHIYKHICTNLQDTSDKFHVYWVTVSQEVDINKLQNVLAKKLNSDLSKDHDIEEKAATLQKALRERKNVVLILDDVWKYIDLEKLGILLGTDGCKVIITSRSLDVCKKMRCKDTIKVQPLSEEEAWKLFLEKLDPENMISPEVEVVAKKMAKKCDGLPLAIITLARSMRGVDDVHVWRDALEQLKQSTMGQNDIKIEVLPILQYSYSRLRDLWLQQCFLYCSLYPEDFPIPRDELISLFISEGLMDQRDTRAAEFDQGHRILDDLVNACLLEAVADWGGQKCVKMHDLVREMAVEITRNKFMIKAGVQLREVPNEQVWTEDLDKVSLMDNYIVGIPEGLSRRCHRLSTLILSYNDLKLIPDSLFAHMHGLRVLNLSFNEDIERLPDSISELENLTALLLGGCHNLWYVPSLRKLKELRELDLSGTGIEKVPEGMECLVKLKCLNMQGTNELEEIPRGLLPRLRCLQRLLLPFYKKVKSEEVESLKLLEEFEGWVDDVDIFYSKWFNKSPPLTFYKIEAGTSHFFDYYLEDKVERHIVLDGCSFKRGGGEVVSLPHDIQCLEIYDYKGLSSCLLEDVPSLCDSKDLQKCVIQVCDEIECIMRISSASNGDGPLQNLEDLSLEHLPNLIDLIKWEPGALEALPPRGTFSSLKELYIRDCHKMKKLFPHKLVVHNLQNLEVIWVSKCDQMEEIIADDEEDEGVGSISHSNNTAFPKLKSIDLRFLPELESICKGEIICCDSIEMIYIDDCPKLKRLPLFHPSPSASSSYSPSSSSRSNDNNQYTNITTFPKLREIWLSFLSELESICNGEIICCDSIEIIDIRECPKLKRLPLFHPSPSADNNQYTNITTFPKLRWFRLSSLPEFESIYEGSIKCCDSITWIDKSNCPKIKRLPLFYSSVVEKPTIPFPKLRELKLRNLPQVKSICNGIMICDSNWSISIKGCTQLSRLPLHLPLIDGQPSPPPSLRQIYISETEKEWWESLEWDHPNSNNVLRPILKYF